MFRVKLGKRLHIKKSAEEARQPDDALLRAIMGALILTFLLVMGAVANQLLEREYDAKEADLPFEVPEIGEETRADTAEKTLPDDENVTLIRKYYAELNEKDLKAAYGMRVESNVSFAQFAAWYRNIEYARPDRFVSAEGGVYDFTVTYKDEGESEKVYGVRMAVADGKLGTASSREFVPSSAKSGAYEVFSTVRGEKMYLLLKKDGKETVLDTAEYSARAIEEGFNESFAELRFSDKGSFILYDIRFYEGIVSKAYSLKTGKTLSVNGTEVGNGFNITPDEKYIYACLGIGMDETIPGKVYRSSDFKQVFDAAPQFGSYTETGCAFNPKNNAIDFTFSGLTGEGDPVRTVSYPLK